MNKNAYIEKCLSELAKQRAKAQATAHFFQMKAKENEAYNEKDKEEKELTFQIGKLSAAGEKTANLEEKLQKTREVKAKILKKMKIDPGSLVPNYSCKKCDDTGYVAGGKPCECLKKRLNALLIKECGAGKQDLASFENFNENLIKNEKQRLTLLKLKKKFEEFASSFPKNTPNFIILSGKTGVGKTFLVECFATSLIKKMFLVSFVSAFGMNNLLLGYHTSFDENKQTFLDALLDPDCLVIDDLGTEPILKNVTREYLLNILSERSRMNKPTIITTNLSPDEILARYNERIFSRLCNKRESFLAHIDGDDLRLSKK